MNRAEYVRGKYNWSPDDVEMAPAPPTRSTRDRDIEGYEPGSLEILRLERQRREEGT